MLPLPNVLELRPLTEADTDALSALVQANADLRWLDWWPTREGNRSFLRQAEAERRGGRSYWSGLWHDGELVGVAGLHEINAWNRSAFLSYWLGAAHQGRGWMTCACEDLVRHGFEELGLVRIQITCATANLRSRALAVRLGFVQEGTLRHAERFNPRVHALEDFPPDAIAEIPPGSGERYFDHALYALLCP